MIESKHIPEPTEAIKPMDIFSYLDSDPSIDADVKKSVANMAEIEPFSLSYSPSTGVEQALLMVIDTGGDEAFAVIAARDKSHKQALVLARIGDGRERADLVDVFDPGIPVHIGREETGRISGRPLASTLSRDHCVVEVTNHFDIIVKDRDSTNGTVVYTKPNPESQKNQKKVSKGTINKMRERLQKADHESIQYQKNPFEDVMLWAPKSTEVQRLLK